MTCRRTWTKGSPRCTFERPGGSRPRGGGGRSFASLKTIESVRLALTGQPICREFERNEAESRLLPCFNPH